MTTATIESLQHVAIAPSPGSLHRQVLEGGIVLELSQAWFWEASWQAGELEASRELEEGRGRVFETPEEFLASLDD